MVAAAQKAVDGDFKPVWGSAVTLEHVPKWSGPRPGAWWIGFFDDSDVVNALGYHDITAEDLPLGKTFAGTGQQYGP